MRAGKTVALVGQSGSGKLLSSLDSVQLFLLLVLLLIRICSKLTLREGHKFNCDSDQYCLLRSENLQSWCTCVCLCNGLLMDL